MIRFLLLLVLGAMVGLALWAHWPARTLPVDARVDRLVVEKSQRLLLAYRGEELLATYPVSLGTVPVGPKVREGDRKTPEGRYHISEHKRDSSYHRALRVSYPGPEDVARGLREGYSPGSDIMIHGLPNGHGYIGRLHRWRDWTAGCVALTNPEIDELFAAVVPDATVELRP
ncbi:MAG: L,D-transpeptidase family protein [Opitutaceae bacterium]|nr:L,D-transpeptidase family protein [Opitutaceae bacterium]